MPRILPPHPVMQAAPISASRQFSPKAGTKIKKQNAARPAAELADEAGGPWAMRWNPANGTPHLAAGRGFRLRGFENLTRTNIEAAGRSFVDGHRELLRMRSDQLTFTGATNASGRWHSAFRQVHQGVPVYGSHWSMSFTRDNRLISFGGDVHPDVTVDMRPKLAGSDAGKLAIEAARNTRAAPAARPGHGDPEVAGQPELTIVPLAQGEELTYKLCWRVTVRNRQEPMRREYLVSADDGSIVLCRDRLKHVAPVTGTVRVEYRPEFAGDAPTLAPSPHEDIFAYAPEQLVQLWTLDDDPGWTLEGEWAFGQPTGGGGWYNGYPDPTSGHTGTNVFGVNLQGDTTTTGGPHYLTTGAIDCSRASDCFVRFWRWLNVNHPALSSATVEISTDGVNWTLLSQNTDQIIDNTWVECRYDISAIADRRRSVYLRWGYSVQGDHYSGWNLDDISVFGQRISATKTLPKGTYRVTPPASSCSIRSSLQGRFCQVYRAEGPSAAFASPFVSGGKNLTWAWDAGHYIAPEEANAYYHLNYIHDYYRRLDAGFTGLEYPLPAIVSIPYYPNAFWDGEILGFGSGDGYYYDNFGLYSEILYHEYTHAVTEKIYGENDFPYRLESGALDEAWSDYFACLLSRSGGSRMGDGGLDILHPEGFRDLNNDVRRDTDWNNQVHADSEMISGTLWDARQALGGPVMDPLVHFARYAYAKTFDDYLTAILIEDDARDGDGDLTNGTPHGQAIFTAAGRHGIGGLQYLGPSILIDDSDGNRNGKLDPGETARLSLTLTNGWADARNIAATLASDDPYIQVSKPAAAFPDIPYGGLGDNHADPFVLTLLPTCPPTHTIDLRLEITAQGPYDYDRLCLLSFPVAVNQLAYDDGQRDIFLGWGPNTINTATAVRFTPAVYPCRPTHVRLFPYFVRSGPITLKLWDDTGPGGLPGRELGRLVLTPRPAGNWVDVDITSLNVSVDQGDIYAGWAEGPLAYYNGADLDPGYHHRGYLFDGVTWSTFVGFGFMVNPMVRLIVSSDSQPRIEPPFEYTWTTGQPVSDCLQARGGIPPYAWETLPAPVGYVPEVQPDSAFAPVGLPRQWQEDDESWAYTLPFAFPFYGATYTSVYVCSNGFLDFASDETYSVGVPWQFLQRKMIAPLWDDVVTSAPGDIYIDESVPGQVTIRWDGVTYEEEKPVAFAVVLFSDGGIRFDYGPGNEVPRRLIGISAGDHRMFVLPPSYNGTLSLDGARSLLLRPTAGLPALPPGVTLDPLGCFAGAPETPGTYAVNVMATDSASPPMPSLQTLFLHVVDCGQAEVASPVPADGTRVAAGPIILAWNGGHPPICPPRPAKRNWKFPMGRNNTQKIEHFPAKHRPRPPNLIVNGDFETGDLSGWTVIATGSSSLQLDDGTLDPPGPDPAQPACQGRWSTLSIQNGVGDLTLFQDVTLPPDSGTAVLSWVDAIHNYADLNRDPGQQFRVEIRNPADNTVLQTVFATPPGEATLTGCTRRSAELGFYQGQTIRIAFIQQHVFDFLNVRLDDIRLEVGATPCGPTYDLYFGLQNPPTIRIGRNLHDPWFRLGMLPRNRKYYWKVVATDCCGVRHPGPVWSFTTGARP